MPEHLVVHLFESHRDETSVRVEGPFDLTEFQRQLPSGNYTISVQGRFLLLSSKHNLIRLQKSAFTIAGPARGVTLQFADGAARIYKGVIRFEKNNKQCLEIHNQIDARHYIASVVGSESQRGFPPESLKAQAILAATKICRLQDRATIGDSTQEQAYLGAEYARPEVARAVNSVWGRILCYRGEPVSVFYHSTCGGKTSSAQAVFGDAARNMPYLKCVTCTFCSASPFFHETSTLVSESRFMREFGSLPVVEKYDCAGRPEALTLLKGGKQFDLSGYEFWVKIGQLFGWDKVPGTKYKFSLEKKFVKFSSTGAGHAVGLCQWGSAGMARAGRTYGEILKYYYPGTVIREDK